MARTLRTPGQPLPKTPEPGDMDGSETVGELRVKQAATAIFGAPAEPLPNAIDIDPKAIRSPVLTNQGWVCPDETGRKPADALKA